MSTTSPERFSQALSAELQDDIVPFWLRHAPDVVRGGFIGELSHDLVVARDAPKGLILNTRLLWAFSAFHRELQDEACRAAAERAYHYLETRFWDPEHGGAFWTLDAAGRPLDVKKKGYGQAFYLYALSEWQRATGSEAALRRAQQIFELIEERSCDKARDGYFESYERDWRLAQDVRLGANDLNEPKSMNNHLHIMEAYSNLMRIWPDERLRSRLAALVELFLTRIIDPETHHLRLFFSEDWAVRSDHVSYGHDIEASWLLCEAAELTGAAALLARARARAVEMAEAVLREGIDPDGGLLYESSPAGLVDSDKHWWPQSEAVVGFLNAFELTHDERYYEAAWNAWCFIERTLLDRRHGEWFYKVARDGTPDLSQPKISLWKCPYHAGRMCLEGVARLAGIGARKAQGE
jgi:cellobiose epimerase